MILLQVVRVAFCVTVWFMLQIEYAQIDNVRMYLKTWVLWYFVLSQTAP